MAQGLNRRNGQKQSVTGCLTTSSSLKRFPHQFAKPGWDLAPQEPKDCEEESQTNECTLYPRVAEEREKQEQREATKKDTEAEPQQESENSPADGHLGLRSREIVAPALGAELGMTGIRVQAGTKPQVVGLPAGTTKQRFARGYSSALVAKFHENRGTFIRLPAWANAWASLGPGVTLEIACICKRFRVHTKSNLFPSSPLTEVVSSPSLWAAARRDPRVPPHRVGPRW
jgi:hypothetical protein